MIQHSLFGAGPHFLQPYSMDPGRVKARLPRGSVDIRDRLRAATAVPQKPASEN